MPTELSNITLNASTDLVKTDLEVTCTLCDAHLCDAEAGDSLEVLADVARTHSCPDSTEPDAAQPITAENVNAWFADLAFTDLITCTHRTGSVYPTGVVFAVTLASPDGQITELSAEGAWDYTLHAPEVGRVLELTRDTITFTLPTAMGNTVDTWTRKH